MFSKHTHEDGYTYDGQAHAPTLSAEDQEKYGTISQEETGNGFYIEWQKVTFPDSVRLNGETEIRKGAAGIPVGNGTFDAFETLVGTHHYKIIDNATGQIVCPDHTVVIKKATPTPLIDTDKVGFVDKSITWSNDLIGIDGKTAIGTYTGTRNIVLEDYAPTSNTKTSDYTTTPPASSKTDESVAISNSFTSIINAHNYNTVASISVSFTVLPTTYVLSGSTATYYGTITDAIGNATSGMTIYPMQSFTSSGTYTVISGATPNGNYEHRITTNSTIANGVTLVVPNGLSEEIIAATNTTPLQMNASNYLDTNTASNAAKKVVAYDNANKKYEINTVTIGTGVTLENHGTIMLPAQISGGGGAFPVNSMVCGNYSRIALEAGAKIQNFSTGTIYCFGFIDKATTGNSSSQLLMDDGVIYTMFTVSEHRGGNVYMGMANPTDEGLQSGLNIGTSGSKWYSPAITTFPFNRFYIASVGVKMVTQSTAEVFGHAVLAADKQNNIANLALINSSTALIQLDSGSRVETQYTNASTEANKKMTIEIYGGAKMNDLELRLSVTKEKMGITATVNVALNSSSTFFPIAHHLDVHLKPLSSTTNCTVDITSQDIKILPGGSLTIHPGVTLKANQMVVYKDATLLNPSANVAQGLAYPTNKGSGTLILNGALETKRLGGNITAKSTTATLLISESASAISYELIATTGTSINIDVELITMSVNYEKSIYSSTEDSTLNATSTVLTAVATATPDINLVKGRSYTALSVGSVFPLFTNKATIKFDPSGGQQVSPAEIEVDVLPTGLTDAALASINAVTATFGIDGINFVHWCVDKTLTSQLTSKAQIVRDATVYAKWDKNTYTISFDSNLPSGYSSLTFDSVLAVEGTTYTPVYTSSVHGTGTDNNVDNLTGKQYYLAGWSKSQTATEPDATITVDGDFTLFAVWKQKHKITTSLVDKSNLQDSSTFAKVTVNGTEYDVKPSGTEATTLWVKPTDTVSVYVSATGWKSGGFIGIGSTYYGTHIVVEGALSSRYDKSYSGWRQYSTVNTCSQTLDQSLMATTTETTITITGLKS